ncbi:MAG: MiaB/RimO family radical SAM methylthiotransferase [Actinomycetota bacterium]
MAKVAVYTIGCKVNQAESEELKSALAEHGHAVIADAAAADLCVVNTCTVTAESDRKCRKLLRALWRRGAPSLVAAGCYAEVNPGDLEGLPGVVRVIPNARKKDWVREILSLLPDEKDGKAEAIPHRTRAFIKVQDGCERGCSYCIVPRARGKESSRGPAEALRAISKCVAGGAREVVLCGVNLGRYDGGAGRDLAYLVREVLRAGEGFRVRLSSIELEDLRTEWIEEWSREGRVCPHLHLPLQSGDSDILADMGRGYGAREYITAVEGVREAWPCAALTTEVMVGYPGESEDAFRNTVEVLSRAMPSRVHVFRFSPRPGTAAWDRAGRPGPGCMEERSAVLRELAEEWRLRHIEEHVGAMRQLLVEKLERNAEGRTAFGTTEDFIKGTVTDPPPQVEPGHIVPVRISGVTGGRALMEAV